MQRATKPPDRALVTGASAGIGEAFARALAARGVDLVLVARREDRLQALRTALETAHGIQVEVLPADLLDEAGIGRVEARLKEPDIGMLVNNAGFGRPGAFAELDAEHVRDVLRLNGEVLLRLTHAALGPMRARGSGQIVQVASIAAFQPSPYYAVYSASKAFVLSFSQAVHEEVRSEGIQVLALCPGFTRSEFQAANGAEADLIPNWMWSTPEQVAEATLKSLVRYDAVLVPRWHDWIGTQLASLAPRKLIRRIAGFVGGRV